MKRSCCSKSIRGLLKFPKCCDKGKTENAVGDSYTDLVNCVHNHMNDDLAANRNSCQFGNNCCGLDDKSNANCTATVSVDYKLVASTASASSSVTTLDLRMDAVSGSNYNTGDCMGTCDDSHTSTNHNKLCSGDAECNTNITTDEHEHRASAAILASAADCGNGTLCTVRDQHQLKPNTSLHINDLPVSILIQVLRCLSLYDLLRRASFVCKRWHALSTDPDLWHKINFRGQFKVTDEVLDRFTSYNNSVIMLDLTDVRLVTGDGLALALKHCTHLRKLSLVRCMQFTDTVLQAIGENCHQLVEVKFDCCNALGNQSLIKLAAGCPKLEKLRLNQCSSISDEGILAVARGCPNLSLLTVEQCRQISDAVLEPLVSGCPDLESLGFMNNNFTAKGVKLLGKLQNSSNLRSCRTFENQMFRTVYLAALTLLLRDPCRKLRVLELTQMCVVTDDCIIHLVKNCAYLKTLNISLCTQVTDKAVRYIAEHSVSMQSLYLVACAITDQALVSLGKHSMTLEKLDVGWCMEISEQGAEAVSQGCRNLTFLGLMRCDKLTKEGGERLVKTFPHINYSTMWLEWENLLFRARLHGYSLA